ncbi:hypothetical protein LX64_00915 [Chitinophaga skermanii]|uniref:Uncharacterized protein n=1 Tax=Chitinophaga skermanii TaxID=331697 RepID=A0A327QWK2_9BACT|nr:hypothetical protein LX64_00915 [Chitinophaga skermanii]
MPVYYSGTCSTSATKLQRFFDFIDGEIGQIKGSLRQEVSRYKGKQFGLYYLPICMPIFYPFQPYLNPIFTLSQAYLKPISSLS